MNLNYHREWSSDTGEKACAICHASKVGPSVADTKTLPTKDDILGMIR